MKPLRLLSILCAFWCFATSAPAEEAITFEMHAVADAPGPHTREYLGVVLGGDGKPQRTLLVEPALLDSSAIRYVTLDYDGDKNPFILINLTHKGARQLEDITKEMLGKQLGMVLGGQLYAIPRVGEPIHGGKIAIAGTFSARQAANLVERLNAAIGARLPEQQQ